MCEKGEIKRVIKSRKDSKMAKVYSLHEVKHGSRIMSPQNTSYSESYAQRMCDYYLTDELGGRYRLHSCEDRFPEQFLPLTILCPKCGERLTPISRAINRRDLLLYECDKCSSQYKNGGSR